MRAAPMVAAGLIIAFLGGNVVQAVAASGDACDTVYKPPMDSFAKLKTYDECRFDRQDATLKRIEAKLATPAPTSGPSPTSSPSTTLPPSSTPKPSSTPSPTPSPSTGAGGMLDLPRIPWEGADYWKQFPKAKAAGWADPGFFPIAVWYGSPGTDAQVKYDKALGINTYAQGNPSSDPKLLTANNMFSLGSPAEPARQVGTLLDDEVDGRFTEEEGNAHLKALSDEFSPAKTGRFRYVNYTSGIVTFDRSHAFSQRYINSYSDAVSLDQYFYAVPHCDTLSLRWRTPVKGTAIDRQNCRTSSSYGKMIDLQREDDAADNKLQAIWAVPTVVSTGGSVQGYRQLTPEQVQGQVMNSLIHEARGIMWFSQSPDQSDVNDCPTGDAFASARQSNTPCLRDQVKAVGRIDATVMALAPVLNSQSYAYDFGSGIDSMLKAKDGFAYVFAMTEDGGAGNRTFRLPAGVRGTSVEVLGENRNLGVAGGTFVDTFANEASYHVYRVAI